MTIGLTELVVMLVGLLFYFLSLKHPSLKPIGLIMFAVGLLLWLPHGPHALGVH